MPTSTDIVVRYAETDAQGIVHHANYLVWFEEGRSDFLRQNGLNYTAFEESGYFIVVSSVEVRYRSPARYEEQLVVETSLVQLRSRMMRFSYRVLDRQGDLRCEGSTTHAVVGTDHRPVALPEEFMRRLKELKT